MKPLRVTGAHNSVELTWLGEGSKWTEAIVVPPPANPGEFAELAVSAITRSLINPRPGITVTLQSCTEGGQATYLVDGGGEKLITYGLKALTPEQCTMDHIGQTMLRALEAIATS